MVAFGDELLEGRVNEWQPYYVNYHQLKGLISEMQKTKSESARKNWEEGLRLNLLRVDGFYTAEEARLQKRVMDLPAQAPNSDDAKRSEAGSIIKDAIQKLEVFAYLNCEGLRKITKKFDKMVGIDVEVNTEDKKLQNQTVEALKTKSISDAKDRLKELTTSIDKWIERPQDWREPLLKEVTNIDLTYSLRVRPVQAEAEECCFPRRIKRTCFKNLPKVARKMHRLLLDNVVIWALMVICLLGAKYGHIRNFNKDSYLVCWVTCSVLILLVRQQPTHGVLIGSALFLTIAGVLTPKDAWAAFANDVVLSVAGLGCIASAVGETGVIKIVFSAILGKPNSVRMAMLRLFLPAMFLNVCISNTCVMACLLPVLDKWSVDIGIHRAFFLMPLSYVLLISGVFAMFSTSTNLIAQGLLASHDQPLLPTFALSGPVVICTIAAMAYLLVATPWVLSRFQKTEQEDDADSNRKVAGRLDTLTYFIRVQIVGGAFPGATVGSSGLLECLQGGIGCVISCERYGLVHGQVSADYNIQLDDVFLLKASGRAIVNVRDMAGLALLPWDSSESAGNSGWESRELVEVVIDSGCPMVKHRMINSRNYWTRSDDCSIVAYRSFKDKSLADRAGPDPVMCCLTRSQSGMDPVESTRSTTVVVPEEKGASSESFSPTNRSRTTSYEGLSPKKALQVGEWVSAADLPEERLKKGDYLIFSAATDFYNLYKDSSDFVVVRRITEVPDDKSEQSDNCTGKAVVAGLIMICMVALVASATLPLLEAVLAALAALIATKCTTLDAVVKAVKLPTVLTIVGAFGLGKAIGQQHVAEALADLLLWLLAPFGSLGLLCAIFAATVALGVVFHGTAVVVLMYPICQEAAAKMNMPIHQVVAVLCIAVSCQMLSPISYQTNLMAYSAGAGYEFTDFTKLGSGLVLVLAVVSIPLCWHWFAVEG